MIDRILISLVAGIVAFLATLVGVWMAVAALEVVGWQIPLAAGVAVAVALFSIDLLTDVMARRSRPTE